jgi:MoaA/NifB/PqqE/SkfB family radical SAM enzyme
MGLLGVYMKINLRHIHLLLTYRCDRECDHCFVLGSPQNTEVMSLKDIGHILKEASNLGTIKGVSFEGGEPFLYYPILLKGALIADELGFNIEVVTNGYWGTTVEDAVEWLKPFKAVRNFVLSLSSDLYHGDSWISEEAENIIKASRRLRLNLNLLTVEYPFGENRCPERYNGLKIYITKLMYRGRAAYMLAEKVTGRSWLEFDECPYEDLQNQERVHIDPYGYIHVCQGITIGNIKLDKLSEIISNYDPSSHEIVGDILNGGPRRLVEKHKIQHDELYADACHLCYDARTKLRAKYPRVLCPATIYGEDLEMGQ